VFSRSPIGSHGDIRQRDYSVGVHILVKANEQDANGAVGLACHRNTLFGIVTGCTRLYRSRFEHRRVKEEVKLDGRHFFIGRYINGQGQLKGAGGFRRDVVHEEGDPHRGTNQQQDRAQ